MNNLNLIYLIISISFLVLAIQFYKKVKSSIASKITFNILVLISVTFYIICFISDHFTGTSINDVILFTVLNGLKNSGYMEYLNLITISFTTIIITIIMLIRINFNKPKNNKNNRIIFFAYFFIIISMILNPSIVALHDINKNDSNSTENTDFFKIYQEPEIKKIGETKNLIFIYLESFEKTYLNESIFPGLAVGIQNLSSQGIYFTNIKQINGTQFTIAGIISSQCGFPFLLTLDATKINNDPNFLPSAVCIGDLLHNEDYYLSFIGGGHLDYTDKGSFFKTHKYDSVKGKIELLPKIEDASYLNYWGLYDDSLLDLAFEEYSKLSNTKDKFALFILTLNTHHPKGYMSRECGNMTYKEGSDPMLNAVKCSDYLISDFVNKIRNSDSGKDTVIVLASDHLAMTNTASKKLNMADRKNLFLILEPESNKSIVIDKLGSTLDTITTVLPFIGYEGKIGLGKNILSKDYSESETDFIHNNVIFWRNNFERFFHPSYKNRFTTKRVAHAAGGINNQTITNSIDALNMNLKNNFSYFEIDLSFTRDNDLVCIHDWNHTFKRLFNFYPEKIPTKKEFEKLVKTKAKFNICTLDSLIKWLKNHPDTYIITDIKENNTQGLQIIIKKYPEAKARIIPQIYHPDEYSNMKMMGFERFIWTLYLYNGSNNEVLKYVDLFKRPFAVTIPKDRGMTSLPTELSKKNITTYVHTINSLKEKEKFINIYNVTEIYTDFLYPDV